MTKRILILLFALLLPLSASAQMAPLGVQGSNAAEGKHLFTFNSLATVAVTWNTATTARYLMVFEGPAPSNGAVTNCQTTLATGCVLYCAYATNSGTAPSLQTFDWTLHPVASQLGLGIGVALSTGAGCATFTVDGSNDFFYGQGK